MAMPSTLPLDTTSEKLIVLGPATGRACQRDVLFVFPLESDSSIFTAKTRAMESLGARSPRPIALIDVSIDAEGFTTFIYNRHCTLIRGRAVGYVSGREVDALEPSQAPQPSARPAVHAAAHDHDYTAAPKAPTAPLDLSGQRPAVRACLAADETASDVTVEIRVQRAGRPSSMRITEPLSAPTYACMLSVFKGVKYPHAQNDYVLEQRYLADAPNTILTAGATPLAAQAGVLVSEAEAQPLQLRDKHDAVRACLAPNEQEADVSVQVQVERVGKPSSMRIAEKLSAQTYTCILGIFKTVKYPPARTDYALTHVYSAAPPSPVQPLD